MKGRMNRPIKIECVKIHRCDISLKDNGAIMVSFSADVDVELKPRSVYISSNGNGFLAVAKKAITSFEYEETKNFQIPTELFEVISVAAENSKIN